MWSVHVFGSRSELSMSRPHMVLPRWCHPHITSHPLQRTHTASLTKYFLEDADAVKFGMLWLGPTHMRIFISRQVSLQARHENSDPHCRGFNRMLIIAIARSTVIAGLVICRSCKNQEGKKHGSAELDDTPKPKKLKLGQFFRALFLYIHSSSIRFRC